MGKATWFAFDYYAWISDTRVRKLTASQQNAWLRMIVESFADDGYMSDDTKYWCDILGMSKNSFLDFKSKLEALGLLKKEFTRLCSHKMKMECTKANNKYQIASDKGRKAAESRWTHDATGIATSITTGNADKIRQEEI